MKLKKVKIKRVTCNVELPDFNATTFSYTTKEPIYTVELDKEEYKLVDDMFKALNRRRTTNER